MITAYYDTFTNVILVEGKNIGRIAIFEPDIDLGEEICHQLVAMEEGFA